MMARITRRLQLTPSALLEKNRKDFFETFDRMRREKEAEEEKAKTIVPSDDSAKAQKVFTEVFDEVEEEEEPMQKRKARA